MEAYKIFTNDGIGNWKILHCNVLKVSGTQSVGGPKYMKVWLMKVTLDIKLYNFSESPVQPSDIFFAEKG